MSPAELTAIQLAVPVGEASAASWRKIWEAVDVGAPVTIRNILNNLSSEGRIKRREVKTNSGFYWVYWREGPVLPVSAAQPSTVLGAG